MASRGRGLPKTAASEPRPQRSWQRTTSASDKEDNISTHSIPNELRPNNWDFSDWRPTAPKDQTKRRKKGNPEWEREQTLSQDSPPPSEKVHGTPKTFPRTKITPSTPTSQRVALENLRQHMTFSDQEDQLSNDGERNNERIVPIRRENPPNYTRQVMSSTGTGASRPVGAAAKDDRRNRNNNRDSNLREGKPDSSQIVSRLMQIRDYIKQASSMMESLRKSGDPPGYKEEAERLQNLIDHLREQERGYTSLLESVLSLRDNEENTLPNGVNESSREETPNLESIDDTQSIEIEIQSQISEFQKTPTPTVPQDRSPSASSRPRIEDKLGLECDEGEEDGKSEHSESSAASGTMDDTVIAGRRNLEWDSELTNTEGLADGLSQTEAMEQLAALRQQQELLKKLIEQQEQMRALRGRQAALLALQQDAEQRLVRAREINNSLPPERDDSPPTPTRSRTSLASERNDISQIPTRDTSQLPTRDNETPTEITDLTQQLQYLRNELKAQNSQPERQKNQDAPVEDAAGTAAMDLGREQLQDKLRDLQAKKQRMDALLHELQTLRDAKRDEYLAKINAESEPTAPSPSTQTLTDGEVALAGAEQTENMAQEVLQMLDAREKLNKLNEVKQRLSQLKSLVSYYQTAENGAGPEADDDEQSSLPAYSDYGEGDGSRARGTVQNHLTGEKKVVQESGTTISSVQESRATQLLREAQNSSSSSDESESGLSSLGPWGDDPEIQEKVRKLKVAKERLHRLQSLVAMVQQSPEVAVDLPDNLAELAAGLPEDSQTDDRNIVSEGEVPVQSEAERDSFYEAKMQEQVQELDELRDEKRRLLAIQDQLQSLHDRFQRAEAAKEEKPTRQSQTAPKTKPEPVDSTDGTQAEETTTGQQSSGPVVTFSSNEEVYDKMRKQRMLREELRDKKKQLESIMKKDRNKKSYYKNQDNQSDTVSYTTDAFGASASIDATMATWGGSTVDNLESITEDGAGDQQDNEDDDDDAYPSDGIVQVEEEEEMNDSDNETYTIEEDVRQRRKARGMARPTSGSDNRPTKGKRSFPRPKGARPKEGAWSTSSRSQPSFSRWTRSKGGRSKQENYRSAEDIIEEDEQDSSKLGEPTEALRQQLEQTNMLCQSLLQDQQAMGQFARLGSTSGFGGMRGNPMMPDLQQQIQQQQFMLSLNQCYQQMSMQQMELQNLQRQIQSLTLHVSDESGLSEETRLQSISSRTYPSPGIARPSSLYGNFMFQPNLSPSPQTSGLNLLRTGFQQSQQSPHSSALNLLRPGTVGDDSVFEGERNQMESKYSASSQQQSAETYSGKRRSGTTYPSASSQRKPESYSQKSKKKTPSPPARSSSAGNKGRESRGRSTAAVQTSFPVEPLKQQTKEEEEDEYLAQLDLDQLLERRRRELLERNQTLVTQVTNLSDTGRVEVGSSSKGFSRKAESGSRYRPGLSAGISGAGYLENASVASSAQSSVAALAAAMNAQARQEGRENRESDDPNELSLFETLRETIYSEVATLISQNENRPHYLIELFRELQLLTSDYLRQRVLYDIKDIVSKFLVDENADSISAPPPPWMNMANFTASELTPSESIVTSDDEDVKTKLKEKISAAAERRRQAALDRGSSLKNDEFDYQEAAEITSSVSTPSTSHCWESPFAQDSLGDTVIHLDKTLQRMREYEKRLAEKEARRKAAEQTRAKTLATAEGCSSSAMDQGSESSAGSVSDVPYPRIDTQQLDQQIKSIMTEVIPVIKEHMDNMCSPQLLAYIKRLVLSLTRQYDTGQEFARFFHRQLGSILQDSLAKYEGRKMRECGEDLLVDMSEVLFNELAFFRLMQDLDDPLIAEKIKSKTWAEAGGKAESEGTEESDTTEEDDSSTPMVDEGDESTIRVATEEEDLGKARDDDFANEVDIQDADEKDDDKDDDLETPHTASAVQIELAVSETKPYTRIGSDEDDEDADESQSNDDPSETAVSRDARMEDYSDEGDEETEKTDGTVEIPIIFAQPVVPEVPVVPEAPVVDQGEADQGAENAKPVEEDGASSIQVNGDLLNGLNGDIEVITMDDIPASMQVMSAEELQERMAQEQQASSGSAAVMASMEVQNELAGDGQSLKEPDGASG